MMNSVLLFETDKLKNNQFLLDDERALHILEHLKRQTGDQIHVTIVGHGLSKAKIQSTTNKSCTLEVQDILPQERSKIEVLVGLSRPPTLKKILEHGTTFGVGRFHFFQAQLSDKSYAQSKVLNPANYEKLLDLGLSQSRHYSHRPEVLIHTRLPDLEYIPKTQRFYLEQDSAQTLKDINIDLKENRLFAFGPERGWSEEEILHLKKNGFQGLNLAPCTLRVEHALFALLAQWHLLF